MDKIARIIQGDALEALKTLPSESVDCCVTSPPYYGLRDYGMPGQIGLEASPKEYISKLVAVFEEVRRVLKPTGTLWLNLGDSYNASGRKSRGIPDTVLARIQRYQAETRKDFRPNDCELKPKDLLGIPWRVALALQDAGWYLRSDVIWAKGTSVGTRWGAPMPESVADRPTRAHEYVFMLTKSEHYYYDLESAQEKAVATKPAGNGFDRPHRQTIGAGSDNRYELQEKARIRSVWAIPTARFPDAHFAVMPLELAQTCVALSCPAHVCGACGKPWVSRYKRVEVPPSGVATGGYPGRRDGGTRTRAPRGSGGGNILATRRAVDGWSPACNCQAEAIPGVVLDPFAGAGTTGLAALTLGRRFIGVELNPEYAALANKRLEPYLMQPKLL